MIRYNKQTAILFFFALTLFFTGCVKKEFDKPPVGTLPVGTIYTIADLRQMYIDSGKITIDYDASVYAVVTMDESSGNIYKSAYVQDNTGALNLHKTAGGGLRIGDSVRVYLKNVKLSDYSGMFQLDNVNPDSNITILATEKYIEPEVVTISDVLSGNYQAKLIKLEDVQFDDSELGKTYGDPDISVNRNLVDCNKNEIPVRTSNYASFIDELLPEGKGSFVAIAGEYFGAAQLYIRSLSDINLTGERCGGGGGGEITPVDEVDEKFNDAIDYEDIDLTGWTNQLVAGDRVWQGKTFHEDKYAQATGHNSKLDDMETWLITPPVINTSGDKKLSFKSAMAYWSHDAGNNPLTVLASTDYNGTNFETANWVDITDKVNVPNSSSGDNNWIETSDVSLADFTGNVAIAFKYKGSDSESTSIRIDDVIISGDGGGGGGGNEITPVDNVNEDFSNTEGLHLEIEGWTNQVVAGDRSWSSKVYQGNKYAQATGYKSELDDMETWLITPPVINTSGDKKLTFRSAMAYWSHQDGNNPIAVLASVDYDGTNFETANWVDITDKVNVPTSSSGDNNWVETSDVSLADFTGNVAVAFKYKGSDSESTSIRIDDVVIE